MKRNIIYTLGIMFLILSSLKFTQTFNPVLLTQAFKENAGAAESLPAEVIHLNSLIAKNGLRTFSLAGALNENPLLHQRAVEYTYPARLDANAKNVFALAGTALKNNCRLTDHQENVEHHVCE